MFYRRGLVKAGLIMSVVMGGMLLSNATASAATKIQGVISNVKTSYSAKTQRITFTGKKNGSGQLTLQYSGNTPIKVATTQNGYFKKSMSLKGYQKFRFKVGNKTVKTVGASTYATVTPTVTRAERTKKGMAIRVSSSKPAVVNIWQGGKIVTGKVSHTGTVKLYVPEKVLASGQQLFITQRETHKKTSHKIKTPNLKVGEGYIRND